MIASVESVNLKGFFEILKVIAEDPRGKRAPSQENYSEWVISAIKIAGTKLRVLRYMLKNLPKGNPPRLLDIGAQMGAMDVYAAKLGFKVSAIDLPDVANRFSEILQPYGVQYKSCDLFKDSLPFEDSSFDYIAYMDVIEHHTFSPRRILWEMRRVLAPKGRIIVTTPNHASIYNRLSLLFGKSVNDDFLYFFRFDDEYYPGHHREYTRNELRFALKVMKFNILEAKVFDDDPRSTYYCLRHFKRLNTLSQRRRDYLDFSFSVIGKVWELLHLPFGRFLWVVGEKE